jgi:hypothetical protein
MKLLAASVLLACVFPAAAAADPTFSVSATPAGALSALPARVDHRLTLTAGATAETVTVSGPGALRVSGVTPGTAAGVPFEEFRCEGRWHHSQQAYGGAVGRSEVTFTIPPSTTAFVDTRVSFVRTPRPEDTLDAEFSLTPASGTEVDVRSLAPIYTGPRGVDLSFNLKRRSAIGYAVQGKVAPARTGRVTLWAYAPGRKRATAIAKTRVRAGKWSIKHLRLPRAGKWEFYARYKSAGTTFADDASPCGVLVGVSATT